MTKQEIANALRKASGEQAFITASDLARMMGLVDSRKVRKEFLDGLEHVGRRYLITDVAEVLKERAEI